jgi:hypothetical protein
MFAASLEFLSLWSMAYSSSISARLLPLHMIYTQTIQQMSAAINATIPFCAKASTFIYTVPLILVEIRRTTGVRP